MAAVAAETARHCCVDRTAQVVAAVGPRLPRTTRPEGSRRDGEAGEVDGERDWEESAPPLIFSPCQLPASIDSEVNLHMHCHVQSNL